MVEVEQLVCYPLARRKENKLGQGSYLFNRGYTYCSSLLVKPGALEIILDRSGAYRWDAAQSLHGSTRHQARPLSRRSCSITYRGPWTSGLDVHVSEHCVKWINTSRVDTRKWQRRVCLANTPATLKPGGTRATCPYPEFNVSWAELSS